MNVLLLIGISGSGKTTFAESISSDFKVVSADNLRIKVCGDINDKSQDEFIYELINTMTLEFLALGYNVVIDTTNLKKERRLSIYNSVLSKFPDVKFLYKIFDVSNKQAFNRISKQLKRNECRANIPLETIIRHSLLFKRVKTEIKKEKISKYSPKDFNIF